MSARGTWRARLISWGRRLVVLAIVGYATYQVVSQWHQVSHTLSQLPWLRLVLSSAAVTAGVLFSPLVWQAMLDDLGSHVRVREASKIYLVGQLGKYVPGSVMALLLQMELARSFGVSRARSLIASVLTAGVAVIASLLAGTLALPALVRNERTVLWLFMLLPIGLVLLHPRLLTFVVDTLLSVLRREPLSRRLSGRAIGRATGVCLLVYVCYGLHLYVLAGSLDATRHMHGGLLLLLCVGAMGLAMTAGLVAFILPSGIGARELIVVAALSAVLPYGQALALAVVSRLSFTVVELATAGTAALMARPSTCGRGEP
ncbi:lysylphosphatidylglycerol synthase domain-containing protein [Modestobacter marinus]|uniref:lysylphosphatidylglycerol synthase domain-containing protein n=1 Tax=Modestobacter marinus TaxID=477641 RepID=UPI001C96BFD5|nr:lysylphosphatidylglycerol synthase domain-containing protein [Modestobacter marinus]